MEGTSDLEQEKIPTTPEWILNNTSVLFNKHVNNIQSLPVLEIAKQFELKSMKDSLDVVVLESWPKSNHDVIERIQFEINNETLKEKYTEMEKEMTSFYRSISNRAQFPREEMKPKMHAVFFDKQDGVFIYKRVKILRRVCEKKYSGQPAQPTLYIVPVCPIDGGHEIKVYAEELLFLYEQFAVLPPRAFNFVLDGMQYYELYAAYRRASFKETGLWNGVLNVSLVDKMSNQVKIYSGIANKRAFPYGIGEVIIRRMAAETKEPRLPEIGNERKGFAVHSLPNGQVFIQFATPFFVHQDAVLNKYKSKIEEIKGHLKPPIQAGTKLIAPHYSYNSYYRAVSTEDSSNETISVKFVDFGDRLTVKVSDVVLASDLHWDLSVIPPVAIPVFLSGIENLDVIAFHKLVNPEDEVTITVTSKIEKKIEVELSRCIKKDGKYMRQNINATLKGEEAFCFSEPEFKLPPSTNICIISPDILSSDGAGSECLYYRSGEELWFQIVEIEEDGIVSVFPREVFKDLTNLEHELAEDYFKILPADKVSEDTWNIDRYFIVKSSAFDRVVRGAYVKHPNRSEDKYSAEVFLIDYGMFEDLSFSSVSWITDVNCRFPAFGCRVILLNGNDTKMEVPEIKKALTGKDCFLGKIKAAYRQDLVPYAVIQFIKAKNSGCNVIDNSGIRHVKLKEYSWKNLQNIAHRYEELSD